MNHHFAEKCEISKWAHFEFIVYAEKPGLDFRWAKKLRRLILFQDFVKFLL
jgi:hypothetical protein